MNIDDILDELPDKMERTRRRLLMGRAMNGCEESKATLRKEYGLTYLFNNGREVRL